MYTVYGAIQERRFTRKKISEYPLFECLELFISKKLISINGILRSNTKKFVNTCIRFSRIRYTKVKSLFSKDYRLCFIISLFKRHYRVKGLTKYYQMKKVSNEYLFDRLCYSSTGRVSNRLKFIPSSLTKGPLENWV